MRSNRASLFIGVVALVSIGGLDRGSYAQRLPNTAKPFLVGAPLIWTKVETARVTYKGKPSRDYGVFRSPGGELFVWVNDAPYPWHYLVRPQEATVETAFQGLLV